jgi:hypothetical protein
VTRVRLAKDEALPSTRNSDWWSGLREAALSCDTSTGTLISNAVIEHGLPVYSASVTSRVYKANHVRDLVAFSDS